MSTEEKTIPMTFSTEKCIPYIGKDGIPSCKTYDYWRKNAGCICGDCKPPLPGLEDHSNCGIHFKYNPLRIARGSMGRPVL
jgi:hypothetical protein